LVAWARERFPLAIGGVVVPACLVALLYGRALTQPGAPRLRPADLAACAAVWAFFLMVRVVDEHKDYERDCAAHPGRVLQRGAVTLDQLKVVAGLAGAIQLAVVLAADSGLGRVGLWWMLALAWVVLAAKDFFLGERVADRPVLYPLLHLPLSALVCVWIAQFGAGARSLPPAAFAVAALGVALSGSVDLVRKLLPAEGGGRAYVVALGARRAAAAGVVAIVVQTAVLATLVRLAPGGTAAIGTAPGGTVAVMILPVLAVAPMVALTRFAVGPTPARGRLARAGMALLIPVQLAVSAAALLVGPGGW
jgi:4-hydroxybenzoate polyprenyltransferase